MSQQREDDGDRAADIARIVEEMIAVWERKHGPVMPVPPTGDSATEDPVRLCRVKLAPTDIPMERPSGSKGHLGDRKPPDEAQRVADSARPERAVILSVVNLPSLAQDIGPSESAGPIHTEEETIVLAAATFFGSVPVTVFPPRYGTRTISTKHGHTPRFPKRSPSSGRQSAFSRRRCSSCRTQGRTLVKYSPSQWRTTESQPPMTRDPSPTLSPTVYRTPPPRPVHESSKARADPAPLTTNTPPRPVCECLERRPSLAVGPPVNEEMPLDLSWPRPRPALAPANETATTPTHVSLGLTSRGPLRQSTAIYVPEATPELCH
ncbi:uncharacterized protein [Drosophila tropicalis]|uniref:uncharacterized protein n=1 Tax=Drosophila tropicalis TaxID=46794 RepID=UPI0035ABA04D